MLFGDRRSAIDEVFESFLAIGDFGFLEDPKAGTGGDQVSKDHVLLETYQTIDLTGKCGFGEDLGGFLEASCRDKAIALDGCLVIPSNWTSACAGLGFLPLAPLPPSPSL